MIDPLLNLTVALGLAVLFAGSCLHKLTGFEEWPSVVRNYRVLPEALAPVAAILIPLTEALGAAALIWAPSRAIGACLAALLLTAYAAALAINLRRGRAMIDCGCFGSRLGHTLAGWMIVRNGVLALLALSLLWPTSARILSPGEVGICLAFVATLAFLYPVVALVLRPNHGRAVE